mmetsp:Transcript_5031/g.18313  ORF Transcript_5031/g.18313 Transcript_5031/m.18313 type:complete len:1772 (-) Transcript_5031:74-5389(-)
MVDSPMAEVVSRSVAATAFGFYSERELRALSVRRVHRPLTLDNMGNPVDGGLYDPALGPIDLLGRCATCGLSQLKCPGHFGHVELVAPVYNPLVFDTLYRFCRAKCLCCHRFKLGADKVDRFVEQLRLLATGQLLEAQRARGRGAAQRLRQAGLDEFVTDADDDDDTVQMLRSNGNGNGTSDAAPRGSGGQDVDAAEQQHGWTIHATEAWRSRVGDFWRAIPASRCENCGYRNPSIGRQGASQLFKKRLSAQALAKNRRARLAEADVLQGDSTKERVERQFARRQRAARKRTHDDDGDDDDDDDDEEDDNDDVDDVDDDDGGDSTGNDSRAYELLPPSVVYEHMRCLWVAEPELVSAVWAAERPPGPYKRGGGEERARKGARLASSPDMFFLTALAVSPCKFRPPSVVDELVSDHPQTSHLVKILQSNQALADVTRELARLQQQISEDAADDVQLRADVQRAQDRQLRLWLGLQEFVNCLMDSTKAASTSQRLKDNLPGVRQQLEKKEGLFRQNMMGKRVNYAARSVISPDPYIQTNEIGIPPFIATKLTFAENVTGSNVREMRKLVRNGPHKHPGATHVEDEEGNRVSLAALTLRQREDLAKRLGSTPRELKGKAVGHSAQAVGEADRVVGKTVHRHLRTGDLLLVNRQPTLHKPGMMAHHARVLRREKTIRMHYANCNTYNADFDGDEINLHFPQDELGRAEAREIVDANQQYCVPTNGGPIRGLIQDHVCAALALSKRDTFLTEERFRQLLYLALGHATRRDVDLGGEKKLLHLRESTLQVPPPALRKPARLWTGKQLFSALLAHFTRGRPQLNMQAGTKTPASFWGGGAGSSSSEEGQLLVRQGELLTGVVDKAQFAKHGLLHCVHELYGPRAAGDMLSALSRLLTAYLQFRGLSCGLEDLLLVAPADARRQEELARAERCAHATARAFVGSKGTDHVEEGAASQRRLEQLLARRLFGGAGSAEHQLDMRMTNQLAPLSSQVIKEALPAGLQRAFPLNQMSLMTSTGAKGSMVNASQISCLLGQQELEGRRVPRMRSGKTLPCFAAFDAGARAGGFIADRFLTGLRPPEFFFHCMAGRDGLVDTTVKTSRSGYLQRCLVKNLESLRVHYDLTVRDCDGSVVQFYYGEDGIDVTRTSCLTTFDLLLANEGSVQRLASLESVRREDDAARAKQLRKLAKQRQLPLMALGNPAEVLGVTSEAFEERLQEFADEARARRGQALSQAADTDKLLKKFKRVMHVNFMRSLADPGEAVGVLAAQSVGEPSTQMTLNTFHFAGRGEANVTLGIPRLREILLAASRTIKTPVMTLPLRAGCGKAEAEQLAARLASLSLASLVKRVAIDEHAACQFNGVFRRRYQVTIDFHAIERYPRELRLSAEALAATVTGQFRTLFKAQLTKELANSLVSSELQALNVKEVTADADKAQASAGTGAEDDDAEGAPRKKLKSSRRSKGGSSNANATTLDEDDDDDDDADSGDDAGNKDREEQRSQQRHKEQAFFDGPDEEELEMVMELDQQHVAEGDTTEKQEADGDNDDATATPSSKRATPLRSKRKSAQGVDVDVITEEGGTRFRVLVHAELAAPHVLVLDTAQRCLARAMVRATEGISKCYVVEPTAGKDAGFQVQTDGINFQGAWENPEVVAVEAATCNDIHAVLETFGVEAARQTLMREVRGVFGAYGIGVDPRHISLIADFMTFQGGYRACNRVGIAASPSPFLKMSFETATAFLMQSALMGEKDLLTSPSSRIVLGRPVDAGTGSFDLLMDYDQTAAK